MNKIYGNLMKYQSGSDPLTMVNQFQIDWYFCSHLLPSVDCFKLCFYVQTLQKHKIQDWDKLTSGVT